MAVRKMTTVLFLLLVPAGLQAEPLFEYRNTGATAQPEPLRETLVAGGQHEVRVDPASLLENGDLTLPDNRSYRLDAMAVRERGRNGLSWHGAVLDGSGEVRGTATFTVQGRRMAGRFTVGGRQFELVSVAPDRHVLFEHDPAAWPEPHPSSGPIRVTPGMVETASAESETLTTDDGGTESDGTAAAESSNHPVVDVTAVYTQVLLDSSFQDEGGVRLSIRNAIDSANTAYINSEVGQRVRMTSLHLIGLDETTNDMNADLDAMTTDSEINGIRDERAGDLVALIGGYQDSGNCGLAYIKTVYGNTSGSGYSVTRFSCLGNQTLAHELGHNMGLAHDPDNTDADASELIEPYAFGYQVDGEFYTIMAYPNGCSGCSQLDHFSNPDVTTSQGTPTGVEDQNDNVRVLDKTDGDIVAYREPVATLGEGLDAATLEWKTGGGAIWLTSDDKTRDGEPVAGSGPVMDGESSWVETTLPHGAEVSFDWLTELTELSGTGVALVLEVDGTPVDTYRDDSGEWQQATADALGINPSIRWQVAAPEGSAFDAVGRAYLANVSVTEVDNLSGTVISPLGTSVPDVNVTVDTGSGETGSAVTGDDGIFYMSLPQDSVQSTDEIQYGGEAVQPAAGPAEDCLNENGPCEQMVEGEARTVSGTVTGLIPGEQFDMELRYLDADGNERVAESETVTADGDGNTAFSLPAESVVVYDALWAVVPGYIANRYRSDDGIRPRSSDIDGIEIRPLAQEPVISNATAGEVTDSGFEVTADVDTRGRSTEARLFYDGDSDSSSVATTVQGEPGESVAINLTAEGLDCGTTYSWRLRAASDTGTEDWTNAAEVRIEGCGGGGGSSGGCSIAAADTARPDPVLGALMLLALAGLGARLHRHARQT